MPFFYVVTALTESWTIAMLDRCPWRVDVHPKGVTPRTADTVLESHTFPSRAEADAWLDSRTNTQR
jgi:hypothetical protein